MGPSNVIMAEGSRIEWTNLTGGAPTLQSIYGFFSSLGPTATNALFDPRIVFDSVNQRYIVTVDNIGSSGTISNIDIAVSKTANPNDGWYFASLNTSLTLNGQLTSSDQPTVSVDGTNIYITAPQYNVNVSGYAGSEVWVIGDTAGTGGGIYNGGALTVVANELTASSQGIYRSVAGNNGKVYYAASYNNGSQIVVSVQAYDVATKTFGATSTVGLGNIDQGGAYTAQQLGTSLMLDAGDKRIQNIVYSNGFLYGVSELKPTGSSVPLVHWFKIDVSNPNSPTLVSQGDISGAALGTNVATFDASIAVNQAGDLIINFTASGPNMYPSDYYVVKGAADTSFGAPVLFQASSGFFNSGDGASVQRWGLNSSAVADPNNPNAFWLSGEYVANGWWQTSVAQVAIVSATNVPTGLSLDTTTDSGAKGDGITNLTLVKIDGIATPGSTVTLYDTNGTTVLGTGAAAATTGAFAITTTALASGVHNISAKATTTSGTSAASAAYAVTIDPTAPVAPTGLSLDATTDSGTVGDGITSFPQVKINGTAEAGSTVTLYDTNGATVLGSGTAAAGTGAFAITTSALSAGAHSITAKATDAAGNIGPASAAFAVTETTSTNPPPAPTGLSLDITTDSGTKGDGATNAKLAKIDGTATPGSTVTLYDSNGSTVIGTGVAAAGTGAFSITTSALSNGTHNITAKASDALGNTSAASASYSTTVLNYDHVVVVIDENHDLDEIIGNPDAPFINSWASIGTVYTNSHGVIHPSQPNYFALFSGSTQGVTDDDIHFFPTAPTLGNELVQAGKTFIGYAETSTTRSHDPWESFGNSQNMGVKFEQQFPTNFNLLPTVSFVIPNVDNDMHNGTIAVGDQWLANNMSAYATWAQANNSLLVFTYDESDDDPTNSIPTIFVGAGVPAGQNNTFVTHYNLLNTIQTIYDLPGLTSNDKTAAVMKFPATVSTPTDTTPPVAPTGLSLDTTTDGGAKGDGITNIAAVKINGTAEAGSTVRLFDTNGTTLLGTGTAAAGTGAFSITTSALASGAHSITAKATDAANNTGPASAIYAVTVDTAVPAAPAALSLDATTDSGTLGDGITTFTQVKIDGTAEAGSTVTLFDTNGTTVLGTGTAAAGTGAFGITTTVLASGAHNITAKATDTAGNTGTASGAVAVTVTTSSPPAPTGLLLDATTDSGTVGDATTNIAAVKIDGTATPGSTVTLFDTNGTTVLGTGTAAAGTGAFAITTSALTSGAHSITAKATVSGVTGPASAAYAVTLDNTLPAAPSALSLDTTTDSGTKGDGITTFTQVKIDGTAEAGSTVTLYDSNGTTVLGTGVAAAGTGAFGITTSTLSSGAHNITAKATDIAGNTGTASAAYAVTVDANTAATSEVNTLFSGISVTSSYPPHNALAVGPSYIVTAEGSRIEWTNLTGGAATLKSVYSFFSPLGATATNALFDPRVAYDTVNNRFIVTMDNLASNGAVSNIDIAVSKTSNPNDGWNFASLNTSLTINGILTSSDRPALAVDGTNIYITAPQYGVNVSSYGGTEQWVIGDTVGTGGGIYNGGTMTVVANQLASSSQGVFAVAAGNNGKTYYASNYSSGSNISLTLQTYDVATKTFSATSTISLGNIDQGGAYTAQQQGTTLLLDLDDKRIVDLKYSNGFLYGISEMKPPGSTVPLVHWFKVDVSNPSAPSLVAQGNISGATLGTNVATFNGSIAVDATGDVVINFTASGPNLYPSDYYVFQAGNAAAGSFSAPIQYQASSGFFNSGNGSSTQRWGLNSTAIADPNNAHTFWVSNEYIANGWWQTSVAQISVQSGPEVPTLTLANQTLTVNAGGSIPLGIHVTPYDVDDIVSVTISGLTSYETITDGIDPTVFSGGSVTLTAAQVNSGLVLHSSYTGTGQPVNNLTITASNTATGEAATSAAQTIVVTDPPEAGAAVGTPQANPVTTPPVTAPIAPVTRTIGAGQTPEIASAAVDRLVALMDQFGAAGFHGDHSANAPIMTLPDARLLPEQIAPLVAARH